MMNYCPLPVEARNCSEQSAARHQPVNTLTRSGRGMLNESVPVPVSVKVKGHQRGFRLKLARLTVVAVAQHELVVWCAGYLAAVVERDFDKRRVRARPFGRGLR